MGVTSKAQSCLATSSALRLRHIALIAVDYLDFTFADFQTIKYMQSNDNLI